MRKKIAIFLILIASVLVVGLVSCTKNKVETPYTRITGKWVRSEYATDDNNNGIIDSWEIHTVETGVYNELLFKSDSTGLDSAKGSPALFFNWKIKDADSVWMAYRANDTLTYYMAAVSSAHLTLTINTSLGLAWYYYDKR